MASDLQNERAWLLEIVEKVGFPSVTVKRSIVPGSEQGWRAFLVGASQAECDPTWDALFEWEMSLPGKDRVRPGQPRSSPLVR
jgi:hypothetical protein